jgi:hypothetical protein
LLEATLLVAGVEKRDTVPAKQKFSKCMVVGDSVLAKLEQLKEI